LKFKHPFGRHILGSIQSIQLCHTLSTPQFAQLDTRFGLEPEAGVGASEFLRGSGNQETWRWKAIGYRL